MSDITINGNVLEVSSAQAAQSRSSDARNSKYIIIQGHQGLTNAQKGELEGLGVQIREYVSEKTYLCRYERDDLSPIRALDFISLADVYHPSLKTSSDLKDAISEQGDEGPYTVDLLLHEDADRTPVELLDELVQEAVVDRADAKAFPENNKVRVTVTGPTIARLESFDEVNRIEEAETIALANDFARKTLSVDFVLNGTEFGGSHQIVAVADTGFDQGSSEANVIHPAFRGKIEDLIAVGRKDIGLTNDPHGHGTHVCGSIVGDGTPEDKRVSNRVRGTAPEAKLIVQSLLTSTGGLDTPDDLLPLLTSAYEQGARIHSNSWTAAWKPRTGQVAYNDWAKSIDKFVFEHPDMIILVAAGNHAEEKNAGQSQIGASSAAKNCITVGATLSTRPNNGKKFTPWVSTQQDPAEIATFSSRGLTKEGRIKPDVMAPGTAILSAASRDLPRTSDRRVEYGTCMDDDWMFMSGTSMATPLVAGCVAALREAVISNGILSPSAALIKALLINGTVDIHNTNNKNSSTPTTHAIPVAPNGLQGFGRLDMTRSIVPLSDDSSCGFVDAGEGKSIPSLTPSTRSWTSALIPITNPNSILTVTLAYTDREGQLLQNDLNLIVQDIHGEERHGNNASADTEYDTQNNIEKVTWEGIAVGTASVTIEAVGGFARFDDPQGFAAVWTVF